MRRIFFVLGLAGIFLLPLVSSSDPPAPSRRDPFPSVGNGEAGNQFRIKGEGRIGQEAGRYIIYADVSSNLPADTLIESEAYYAKKIPNPLAVREATGQEYDIEMILLAEGTERIKENTCTIKMGYFSRVPYAGEYLLKVRFNPASQPTAVRTKLPADIKPIEQSISFTYGSQEDLEQRKKEVGREIYGVMKIIKELYEDLQREVEAQHQHVRPSLEKLPRPEDSVSEGLTGFDKKRWDEWISQWEDSIKAIEQDNQARSEHRIYWLESTGKFAIKELGKRLKRMVQQYPEPVKTPEETYKHFLKGSAEFSGVFSSYLEQLGYDMIINEARVEEILKALRKNYGALKKAYHEMAGEKTRPSPTEWTKRIASYKTRIEQDLFELVQETPEYIFATYTVKLSKYISSYINECTKAVTETKTPEQEMNIKQLEEKIAKGLEELNRALEIE